MNDDHEHFKIEDLIALLDPVSGGDDGECGLVKHLLASTSCARCGAAGYDLIRLQNLFRGRPLLDVWHLYQEWSSRIEAGELAYDIEPEDFARIAILTCPRLMEHQASRIEPVARAALDAVRRSDVDNWTGTDLELLAQAWLIRSMRLYGKNQRAISLSSRASRRLKGRSPFTKGEVASIHSSCLHDLGKPHRALLWCEEARRSFLSANLRRDAAQQLFVKASVLWEFWYDDNAAAAAIQECLSELPVWDRLWIRVANLSLMRYRAEGRRLASVVQVEPFDNPRWEFVRRWTYAKAYKATGQFGLAHTFYDDARSLLSEIDPENIELELDYCGLLVNEGRPTSEILVAVEKVFIHVERSPIKDYLTPALKMLRQVVARRIFSEEIFRYLQRRATMRGPANRLE